MNALRNTILLHPVMLVAGFALIGIALMINPLRDWLTWHNLENNGQLTPARLIEVEDSQGVVGNTTYRARYQYQMPGAEYTVEQEISPALYEDIRLKSDISVLVLPDDPDTARIVGSKPAHAVSIIRGVLVMLTGVLLWLIREYQQAPKQRPAAV